MTRWWAARRASCWKTRKSCCSRIVAEKLLTANAVMGFFPANSVGDDIEVYADASRSSVLTVFHTLRQQMEKAPGHYNWALADLIAPKQTGLEDYLGAFAVTAGADIEPCWRGSSRTTTTTTPS